MMIMIQNPNNGGKRSPEPEDGPVPVTISNDDDLQRFSEDFDSTCSTPYVSAPSSPGRGGCGGSASGYFFSAPASPMHFVLLSSAPSPSSYAAACSCSSETPLSSSEFEFSSRFSPNGSSGAGLMSSADELFLNGQIRPMKLSSHLQRPQILAPLIDLDAEEEDESEMEKPGEIVTLVNRGRDVKLRSRSLHRKARSLSPLRKSGIQWLQEDEDEEEKDCAGSKSKDSSDKQILDLQNEAVSTETTPSCSTSSSRSSSTGRNSKKWIFLKDLLYRSKSEGRGNGKEKFWSSISFSPSKEKLSQDSLQNQDQKNNPNLVKKKKKQSKQGSSAKKGGVASGRPTNGVVKRRVPPSLHELHYTANRAQAEEMKKKTFLPYRQGLLGCLGFSSKGYGALNGLTRALNPVSSR